MHTHTFVDKVKQGKGRKKRLVEKDEFGDVTKVTYKWKQERKK